MSATEASLGISYTEDQIKDAITKMGFLYDLGVSHTDPKRMTKIMTMCGMDYREHPAIKALLSKPIPFAPLINQIIKGIVNNQPLANALVKSSQAGVQYHKQQEELLDSMHYTVLLEVMTTLMVNDIEFASGFQDSFLAARGENPGSSYATFIAVYQQTKDVFTAIKTISVEPSIWGMRFWREQDEIQSFDTEEKQKKLRQQLHQFSKEKGLGELNAAYMDDEYFSAINKDAEIHAGIQINISEALISQIQTNPAGCDDNVAAGAALIQYFNYAEPIPTTIEISRVTPNTVQPNPSITCDLTFNDPNSFWDELYQYGKKDNKVVKNNDMPAEWVHLYESWNMQFVAIKFPEVSHWILPKLFIPATLCAKPENYLATRPYSLWLTLIFMNKMMQNNHGKIPEITPPKYQDKLFTIWAAANKQYAVDSLLAKVGVSLDSLDKFFTDIFKPLKEASNTRLAVSFIALALAIRAGIKVSIEPPEFMNKYMTKSTLLLLFAVALIVAGSVTFGTSSVVGIALLAAGGFLGISSAALTAVNHKEHFLSKKEQLKQLVDHSNLDIPKLT